MGRMRAFSRSRSPPWRQSQSRYSGGKGSQWQQQWQREPPQSRYSGGKGKGSGRQPLSRDSGGGGKGSQGLRQSWVLCYGINGVEWRQQPQSRPTCVSTYRRLVTPQPQSRPTLQIADERQSQWRDRSREGCGHHHGYVEQVDSDSNPEVVEVDSSPRRWSPGSEPDHRPQSRSERPTREDPSPASSGSSTTTEESPPAAASEAVAPTVTYTATSPSTSESSIDFGQPKSDEDANIVPQVPQSRELAREQTDAAPMSAPKADAARQDAPQEGDHHCADNSHTTSDCPAVVLKASPKHHAHPTNQRQARPHPQSEEKDWDQKNIWNVPQQASKELQKDLERRNAMNNVRDHSLREPSLAAKSNVNVMFGTWFVSNECCPKELVTVLAASAFTVIVIMVAPAVADNDYLFKCLRGLVDISMRRRDPVTDIERDFLVEHSMSCAGDCLNNPTESRAFVCCNKAKVLSSSYTEGKDDDGAEGIRFGFVRLVLDTTRQRLRVIKVGIIDVYEDDLSHNDPIWDSVASWLYNEEDPVDLLTGFFGKGNCTAVAKLARRTNAMLEYPLYQAVALNDEDMPGGDWVFPNYTIAYGHSRCDVCYLNCAPAMPDRVKMGSDITAHMETYEGVPRWRRMKSREGIEWERFAMKKVDWRHWFTGCFQTVVWIGKSNPGQGAVRQEKRVRSEHNKEVSRARKKFSAAATPKGRHAH